jgi:hypothetical protein
MATTTQPLMNMIETLDQNIINSDHNANDDEEKKMLDKRTDLESIELTKIAKLYKELSLEHKKKFFKSLISV